ncbi:MAG: hypothetical protein HY820_02840 [Acidobacteria bacterium]|nr:hypothetical protein [Acidobacteriota bacterium]
MAKLTKLDEEIFSASAGTSFQVEMNANRGAVAVLSARYGSQSTTNNPTTFNVEAGVNDVIYVFQATNNDALIRLEELDGANKQRLAIRPAFDGSLSVEVRPAGAAESLAAPRAVTTTTRKAVAKRATKARKQ